MSLLARRLAEKGVTIRALPTPSKAKKQCLTKHSSDSKQEDTRSTMASKSILMTLMPRKLVFALTSGETGSSGESTTPVDQLLSGLPIGTDPACTMQTIKGLFSYAHVSAWWTDFDFAENVNNRYALLWILLHNGVKENSYTIAVKLKLPKFID